MDLYSKLKKKPFIFQRITGITPLNFQTILQKLTLVWKKKYESKKRLAGRPYGIKNLANQFLGLLMYYRTYTTQLFIGFFFHVDDATVSRTISRLEPILAKVNPIQKDRTLQEEELKRLLVDCTEQPIQRPTKKQRRYYSGKKKQHTLKTEIIMNQKGKIVHISKPHAGSIHDFTVRKNSAILPPDSMVYADSGYQGLQKIHHLTKIPIKKKKGKSLTPEAKGHNKELSRLRVPIEHKIREIKTFQILSQKYRNYRKKQTIKMNIVSGIVNMKHGF